VEHLKGASLGWAFYEHNKPECFLTNKSLNPSLMFVGEARSLN
jgi:hypothetical protein